jgi:alpha-ketoglutarate-dependent taurine dioxygenase
VYKTKDVLNVSGKDLLLKVDTMGLKPLDWAKKYQREIDKLIQKNGAVLLRGLNISSSKTFAGVIKEIFGSNLLSYTYRSTPRTGLKGNIYTATEYPASEVIPQHNENSYSKRWPNRIAFFCLIPAEKGGETPISDSRLIYQRIPEKIRAKFEEKGIAYVRNYSEIDLPWTQVFQTDDKQEVERFCHENQIEYEWFDDGRLRTKQVNAATINHPVTGEKVWFNQAHLFHVSNLAPDIAQAMMTSFGTDNLPRNAFYGDGSEIDPADLAVIKEIYKNCQIRFPWKQGDLLLLDNVLFTHGREPFEGTRKILVGMSNPNV